MSDVVYALDNTFIDDNLQIRRGQVFWADSAEVKRHPEYFSADPPEETVRGQRPPQPPVVEQATAAPGEKRNTGRGKDA